MLRFCSLFTAVALMVMSMGCRGDDATTEVPTPRPVNGTEVNRPAAEGGAPVVLFLGDSITAGYGLEQRDAFPAVIERRLENEGLPAYVIAAGQDGDTTAGGLRRIEWLLRQDVPDVLVLALGGNDGLRGIDVASIRANLDGIIERTRQANPQARVVLVAVDLPPSYGEAYVRDFRRVYEGVAADHRDVEVVHLLPDGFEEAATLVQPDGIHPTAQGQEVIADRVWPAIISALS